MIVKVNVAATYRLDASCERHSSNGKNYLHIRNGMEFNVREGWRKRIQRWAIHHYEPSPSWVQLEWKLCLRTLERTLFTLPLVNCSRSSFCIFILKATSQEKFSSLMLFILLNKVQIKQEIKTIYAEMVYGIVCVPLQSAVYGLTNSCGTWNLRSRHGARSEPDHSHQSSLTVAPTFACMRCMTVHGVRIESGARQTQHVVCCSSNLLLL